MLQAVFHQPDGALREVLGVNRPRLANDLLDVLGQLRLGPHDAADAEQRRALRVLQGQELLGGDEAERARRPEVPGDAARDDVHFVQPRAGDQDVGLAEPGPAQHVAAGARPQHELHVDGLEAAADFCRVVDDGHVVFGQQGLGKREPDLAPAYDHDVHAAPIVAERSPGAANSALPPAVAAIVSNEGPGRWCSPCTSGSSPWRRRRRHLRGPSRNAHEAMRTSPACIAMLEARLPGPGARRARAPWTNGVEATC